MRKAQKQEILEMIQTLYEAHDEVKNYINKKNIAVAQDILGQCQDCAISIGTAIENLEGEGFITISYIESYCETLFRIYEELNGTYADANKIHKSLKKQLLAIENSVKNDVPIHKEVVFFPYKASMWDSLESVYLAAKEDPNCTAYCVPIPYYDRNPDGSLGQMHYEGRQYPKNIEVIDWQTYNFEERKPDAIYIHNPYDGYNFVTCVHPRYFSENLKKYTDELVYIPYFVLNEIEPDDEKAIEGMKHFCFLPGTIYADKVILQSEKMKQIYVNEYLKEAKSKGFTGKHIDRKAQEAKFLGLGSPKFDKVNNTRKEDLEIPTEWLKIIEKPDGSWKKIIFYNTSIAAFLDKEEKMLEKMKYVFSIFKENTDEVVLLWRPHPLIQSTIKSMKPKLWTEYEKILNEYRKQGWGIYDDTAELDRAIAMSDAYYGDSSSVVELCKNVKIPVLLQNVDAKENEETVLYRAVKDGEHIWFVSSKGFWVYLFELNLSNNTIKCLGKLGLRGKYYDTHSTIAKVNEKVIVAPYYSNEDFVEYDLVQNKIIRTPLKCELNSNFGTFTYVIIFGESVFFIGSCNDTIVEYKIKDNIYVYHKEWAKSIRQKYDVELFFSQATCIDGILYLFVFETNIIIQVDLSSCDLKQVDLIPHEFKLLSGIYVDGTFFLIPLEGNVIIKWDVEKRIFKQIVLPVSREIVRPFKELFSCGEYIMFIPENSESFYKVNRFNDNVQEVNDFEEYINDSSIIRMCGYNHDLNNKSNNYSMWLNSKNNLLMIVNENGDIIKQCDINLDVGIFEKEFYDFNKIKNNLIMQEKYYTDLEYYVKL